MLNPFREKTYFGLQWRFKVTQDRVLLKIFKIKPRNFTMNSSAILITWNNFKVLESTLEAMCQLNVPENVDGECLG